MKTWATKKRHAKFEFSVVYALSRAEDHFGTEKYSKYQQDLLQMGVPQNALHQVIKSYHCFQRSSRITCRSIFFNKTCTFSKWAVFEMLLGESTLKRWSARRHNLLCKLQRLHHSKHSTEQRGPVVKWRRASLQGTAAAGLVQPLHSQALRKNAHSRSD